MSSQGDAEDIFRRNLAAHLAGFTASPILFVGSGVSRRYLDMPDWQSLLTELAALTEREYSYYRSTASDDLPKIAELLVEPLKEKLWTPKEKSLRTRNVDALLRPDSALKIYVSEILKKIAAKKSVPKAMRSEVDAFRNAKVDAIITTNYDMFLEEIFPDYRTFVGQDELVFSDPTGVAEIYKIHGSLSNPNTLVITESDYKSFRDRNAYLAAKMLTFFAEHPIIFIGYSMTDGNVQSILSSLANCLTDEHMSRLQDRLLFVNWSPGSQHSMVPTVIGANSHNIPVQAITVPNFQAVFDVLAALDQKIPKRTLRQIKEKIYKLVLDSDAQDRLMHVTDLDVADDAEVVIGVGVIADVQRRGYKMVTRQELCHDALHDTAKFDSDFIVKMTLPEMMSRAGNFPMYKYLKEAGYLDANGHVKNDGEIAPKLLHRIKDTSNLRPSQSVMRKAKQVVAGYADFDEMNADYEYYDDIFTYFGAFASSQIDTESLRAALIDAEKSFTDSGGKLASVYTKAVCVYDLLRYGPRRDWGAS
ncbi:SIR2 family protein [Rhodococcus sp. ARC_M13]|uniref:SIR2 family protein n=1 Tax=unclassified Rhodococcus (in: high G+C Gram-positive bacteria) TaxID=192944 RepID=UPI001FB1F68F|nr:MULTISPECIES: SIR2 family protein [unclassified Rhodococcus (in: high G+C Gram-positive bacteria)]MCJ0899170.1 SIR2 family protein [Rhodococcus sp. ARC_M13]MCJ0948946.1 SIR2 family protein [Rhodococcus sp. ARC_M8]